MNPSPEHSQIDVTISAVKSLPYVQHPQYAKHDINTTQIQNNQSVPIWQFLLFSEQSSIWYPPIFSSLQTKSGAQKMVEPEVKYTLTKKKTQKDKAL